MSWPETVAGIVSPLIASALAAISFGVWRVIRRMDHLNDRISELERQLAGIREDYREQAIWGRDRRDP